MKVAPWLPLVMLAGLAAGCRTAGTDSIAHTRPPEVRPRPSFDIDRFVAQHNENAGRIQSVEARPSISVKMGPPGEVQGGGADGRLAMERPRSFKLELYHGLRATNIADIGSNDEKFWFWFANKKDKSVYYCNYDDLSSTSLAVTYQPDWIVEAMGLKAITPREAAQIKARPAAQPGMTELLFPPTRTGGQTYSRIMTVSDRTLRLQEFRIKDADGKTVIALATIKKYQTLPAGRRPAREARTADPAATRICVLPENIVLEWKKELLSLDVVLKDAKVNQFDPQRREAVFVEPVPSGYARANLAELARTKESDNSTAVRETIPVPDSRSRARLGPPLQVRGDDDAASASSLPARSGASNAMLLPVLDLDVVRAPSPTAPGSQGDRSSDSFLATAPPASLER